MELSNVADWIWVGFLSSIALFLMVGGLYGKRKEQRRKKKEEEKKA